MAQRLEMKETKQIAALATVELKGERPQFVTTDEIKRLITAIDTRSRMSRYASDEQKTIKSIPDQYLLNLQKFFKSLPDTEQNRELTAQEIFVLKGLLFAQDDKLRLGSIEPFVKSIKDNHQNIFVAIDLVAMVPDDQCSDVLLLAILERFSSFRDIRSLFDKLYYLDLLNEANALSGIRFINNFFIYERFFVHINHDIKDRINFHLLFKYAPQIDACIYHYNTQMMDRDHYIIRLMLMHLEYINEIKNAQDFYYRIADNTGNRFIYLFDAPNHMVKLIQSLSKLGQHEFHYINIDFMKLLFSNIKHVDRVVSARNILLRKHEDAYDQTKRNDKIENSEKITRLEELNKCIIGNYKFFEYLVKKYPQYADSLAHISLVLLNRDLYNQEIDKIYKNLVHCDAVSDVFSKIQARPWLTKEVCKLVLDNIKYARQLGTILFYHRNMGNEQSNIDLLKQLLRHISLWGRLIEKLHNTFEYNKYKGQCHVDNHTMLSYLAEIKYKNIFLSGLDPRLGANSSLFRYFGHSKGIPNHKIGDDNVLKHIESFISTKSTPRL